MGMVGVNKRRVRESNRARGETYLHALPVDRLTKRNAVGSCEQIIHDFADFAKRLSDFLCSRFLVVERRFRVAHGHDVRSLQMQIGRLKLTKSESQTYQLIY